MTDWVQIPDSRLPVSREEFLPLRERVSVLEERLDEMRDGQITELFGMIERLANSVARLAEVTVTPSLASPKIGTTRPWPYPQLGRFWRWLATLTRVVKSEEAA